MGNSYKSISYYEENGIQMCSIEHDINEEYDDYIYKTYSTPEDEPFDDHFENILDKYKLAEKHGMLISIEVENGYINTKMLKYKYDLNEYFKQEWGILDKNDLRLDIISMLKDLVDKNLWHDDIAFRNICIGSGDGLRISSSGREHVPFLHIIDLSSLCTLDSLIYNVPSIRSTLSNIRSDLTYWKSLLLYNKDPSKETVNIFDSIVDEIIDYIYPMHKYLKIDIIQKYLNYSSDNFYGYGSCGNSLDWIMYLYDLINENEKIYTEKEIHSLIYMKVIYYSDVLCMVFKDNEGIIIPNEEWCKSFNIDYNLVKDFLTPTIPDPLATSPTSPRATFPTGPDLVRDFTASTRKRKSKQAAASVLTRDWLPPTLGTTGLLGIG